MNDIVTREESVPVQGFQRQQLGGHGMNVGAVAIESERAIAEAQGQLILAKRFPRDLTASDAELRDSCKIMSFAKVAFYSVPRGGGKVSGPSIRMAEEIARVYGNFEFGHRELARTDGKSEIEVYAWDKEKNNRSIRQITVMHVLDTKDGPRKLRDQKDVDDKIANVASKQVRGRILALMPKWLVESAIEECKKTLAGTNTEPLSARVRSMAKAFETMSVTADQLAAYIGHSLDDLTIDELIEMQGVFNAIREGAKVGDYFGTPAAANDNTPATTQATAPVVSADGKQHAATAAAQKRTAKATPSPAPAPVSAPAPAPQPAPAPVAAEPPPVEAGDPGAQGGDFF